MTATEPIDLLLHGGHVLTMDDRWRSIENGAVAIRGSEIVDVGPTDELQRRFRGRCGRQIEVAGRLVMPGLINTHTHGADALFRGLIDDLPLEPWLERLWKVEKRILDPDSVYAGARLAYAEMIRGGTTTALDMFWYPVASARAAQEAGLRVITGPIWFDSDEIDGLDADARKRTGEEFLQQFRSHPLVTPCLLPHGTYTVAPEGLADVRELAEIYGVLVSTHLSETAAEVSLIRERYGQRPPVHLERHGLLGPRTVLAHCVHLEQQEIDLIARRQAVVAHCPLSNLKLGSGVAPLAEMRRAGVRVGLGTDGPVSGNDLDMWLTLRLTAVLHKGIHQDPSLIAARDAVTMATREAAAALGMGDSVGSLETGKRADLIVVDLDRPHLTPMFDVYSHLVYSVGREDVETVMIHGQIVMENRRLLTVDEAAAIAAVREIAATIND